MGFFSNLFGGSAIEKQMLEQYAPLLVNSGFSSSDAKQWVEQALREAKEESRRERMDNLPPNFGDYVLSNEAANDNILRNLAKARQEGATDEDIRQWYNLHDLERRMAAKWDDVCKMAVATQALKEHEQEFTGDKDKDKRLFDTAADRVRKAFPLYGDPEDTSQSTGEDRPLPWELKMRVVNYIQRRSGDLASFQMEVQGFSSFNAFIREEIRRCNL